MGLIKTLAKTYGNYFLTVQGVKVMKTIKKDDNVVVGLGKLFIADKLMDTARWLIKPEEREWNFLGLLAIIFIKPIIGIVKFFWMIISFAVQLLFYKLLFKILDWLFKLI